MCTSLPPDSKCHRSTYRDAGVDLAQAASAKDRIRLLARSTFTSGVLEDIGSFGGLFSLNDIQEKDPVLVASADGVGTKLKLAFATGIHNTVGRDLVAHCVNDILTQGARPLFFLDYIATGKLDIRVIEQIVAGLAEECRQTRCALIGGETAQMPDFYAAGEYDLAGFIVGWVSRNKILGPSRVKVGDQLLGLASSGLHTNGYSLARKILLEQAKFHFSDTLPRCNCTLAEELLKTHRCYLPILDALLDQEALHAMAHITGGGITENLPRVLPDGLSACIRRGSWPGLGIFTTLQELGAIEEDEMYRVFNMGLGLLLIVGPEHVEQVQAHCEKYGEKVYRVGEIVPGPSEVQYL
jgi:phosphoribosylformylglycinamidine cyclo-ligase